MTKDEYAAVIEEACSSTFGEGIIDQMLSKQIQSVAINAWCDGMKNAAEIVDHCDYPAVSDLIRRAAE